MKTNSSLLGLFTLLLSLTFASCQEVEEIEPVLITGPRVSLHKGNVSAIDSAFAEFYLSDRVVKRPLVLQGDSLMVSLDGLTGPMHIEVRVHTPAPAAENRSVQTRYAFKTYVSLQTSLMTGDSWVLSSPGSENMGRYQEPWEESYVYKVPTLQWWVPKNPCSPYVEVISKQHDQLYAERVFKKNGAQVFSESMESMNYALGRSFIREVAFVEMSLQCPQYDEAEATLRATNTATGLQQTIHHKW